MMQFLCHQLSAQKMQILYKTGLIIAAWLKDIPGVPSYSPKNSAFQISKLDRGFSSTSGVGVGVAAGFDGGNIMLGTPPTLLSLASSRSHCPTAFSEVA